MGIVTQSPPVSYSPFPPRLMLCAPRIAGLLCAPKEVKSPQQLRRERIAAFFEESYARLQIRYAEIDRKVNAMYEFYGLTPPEIIINGTVQP